MRSLDDLSVEVLRALVLNPRLELLTITRDLT